MRVLSWLLAVLLILQFPNGGYCASATLPPHPIHTAISPHPLNLDSTQNSVRAHLSAPVSIEIGGALGAHGVQGGAVQTINPGQLVTPAVAVALREAIHGTQTLILNSSGAATGGYFVLGSGAAAHLSALDIPTNVSALLVSRNQPITIGGLTQIQGSLYALQTAPGAGSVLNLGSLSLLSGGLLSAGLPTSFALPFNLFSSESLTLNITGNLSNSGGTILSPGALTINAGGNINNQSTGSNTALVQAGGNLNLQASAISNQGTIASELANINTNTSSFTNAGLMQASSGSIIIQNALGSSLSVNNSTGTILAGQSVTFQTAAGDQSAATTSQANLTVAGGVIQAPSINFDSPGGLVYVQTEQLSGRVNVSGCSAQVGVNGGTLEMGNMNLTGDPSFYNTAGNVVIDGSLSFSGQNLAIVAGGDILTGPLAGSISTSSSSTNGGAITMIAGAQFSTSGASSSVLPASTPSGDTTSTLTILGGSTIGGKIDLNTNGPITSFTSQSTHTNGSGGAVTLLAFSGTNSSNGAGTITLPTGVTITASGNGTGTNGEVQILAGGTSGTGITTGAITSSGGATAAQSMIEAATPTLSSTFTILNGVINSGIINAGTVQAASISTGAITMPGATLTISSGDTVSTGAISMNGAGSGAGGSVTIATSSSTAFNVGGGGSNGSSGAITASSTGGSGGTISITNSGSGGITDTTSASDLSVSSGGTAGAGGSITLNAVGTGTGGPLTLGSGFTIAANGSGSGKGGSVTLSGASISESSGLVTVTANGGATGAGGTVSITSAGSSGNLTFGTSGSNVLDATATGGSTSGAGGTLTVSSGNSITVSSLSGLDAGTTSGAGGNYTLTAAGTLAVTGNFSANAAGTGAGGSITIATGSNTAFSIDSGSTPTNGVSGTLTANGAGSGSADGNGGTISVTSNGTGSGSGITVANNAAMTVSAAGTTSTGGSITLNAAGSTSSALTFSTTAPSLSASSASGSSGQGGSITLNAGIISVDGASGALTLAAAGGGTGAGGSVSVTTTNTTTTGTAGTNGNITINTGSTGNMLVTARGGTTSGAGGSITLSAGGNLIISSLTTATLNSAPTSGAGGSYILSGTNVSIPSALNANAVTSGAGGVIQITSNSGTAFNIGGGGTNGITGALTANAVSSGAGGQIKITNNGGGITHSTSASDLSVTALGSVGTGGTITLDASGTLTIGSGYTIAANASAPTGGSSGAGGNITLEGSTITSTGLITLQAKAGTTTGSSGAGGNVTVEATGTTGNITLNTTGAGAITISATGGASTGAGGSITVSAGNTLTVSASGALSAAPTSGNGATYSLTAGTASGAATPNLVFSGAQTLSANAVSATGQTVAVTGGSITLQGATITDSSGLITLTANGPSAGSKTGAGGSISITTTSSTSNIPLAPTGNGNFNLSATGGATSGAGGSVTLSSGDTITMSNTGTSLTVAPASGNGGQIYMYSGTALSGSTSGGYVTLGLGLSVSAAGTGNGGTFSVITNSSTNLLLNTQATGSINGSISAVAASSGNGGSITLENTGTGGVNISNGGLSLNGAGTNYSGGNLTIVASNGTLTYGNVGYSVAGAGTGSGGTITLTGNTISCNGEFTLNANGGSSGSANANAITITAGSMTLGGGTTILEANGGGTGSGGGISITFTGATSNLEVQSGGNQMFQISATGGATSGAGGDIALSAGKNLIVNTNGITAGPQGGNSNGSSYTLIAGTAATTGYAEITGNLSSSAKGTGNAGNISISYNDTTTNDSSTGYNFEIGGNATNSFVSGTITASSPSTGTPGNISITNSNTNTGTAVETVTTVTANNSNNARGTLTLNGSGGSVTSFENSSGTITANLAATGSSVTITDPDTTWLNSITASAGAISVTTTGGTSPAVTVNYGSTISATGGSITINAPSVTNYGTITSSGAGNEVTLEYTTGNFTLAGLGHIATSSGTIAVTAESTKALTFSGSQTYNSNGGTITFSAAGSGGSITISPGVVETILSNSVVSVNTPKIILSEDSGINASGVTSQTLNFNGDSSAGLDVQAPAGYTATFATGGGQMNFTMPSGEPLTFDTTSPGGSTATLDLNGGLVTTTTSAATTVNATVTVATNNSITLNVNGSTLSNSGTITSSAIDGIVTVQSTSGLTIAGTGTISTTGGVGPLGGPTITISAAGGNTLSFTGSQTFSATSNGIVVWSAPTLGATISIGASQTETIGSAFYLQLAAPTVALGAGSAITASSSVVYVDAGCATCALTVNSPGSGSSATITGTQLTFFPLADGANIAFGVTGGGTSTLNVNGYFLTSTSNGASQTFASGLTVASNNSIELDAVNGGVFNLNGTLQSTLTGGQVWLNGLQGGGTMTVNLPSINNATTFIQTAGSININASTGLTFQTTAPAATLSLTGGPANITTNSGNVTIGAGVTITTDHNLTFNVNGPGTFSDSGTITSSAAGSGSAPYGGIFIYGGGASGTAGFTMTGTPFGACACIPITETGTGTPTISIVGFVDLNITASYQFNPGSSGTVSLVNSSQTQPTTIGTSGSSVTLTVPAGSLSIGTDNLILTNSPTINVQTTSGTGITFTSNTTNQLISAPGGTTALIETSGSNINISPYQQTRAVTFQQSGGSGTTTFDLNGGPVTVTTTSAQINVNANVTVSSNNSITLNAIDSGVVNAGIISGGGGITINAPTVTNSGTIQALSSNLSINGSNGLVLGGGGGLAGTVVTLMANGGALTVNQGSVSGTFTGSGTSVSLTTSLANSLTLGSLTSTNGSIGVYIGLPSATATVLSVLAGAGTVISATGGSITLQNNNTTALKGTISVGANATIETSTTDKSQGSVTFSIGTAGTPVAGSAPGNVTVTQSGGGQVYWGTSGITTSSPPNVLNALGANVIFNGNSSSAITLGGGTTITADPPVSGPRYTYTTGPSVPDTAASRPAFSVDLSTMPVLQKVTTSFVQAPVPAVSSSTTPVDVVAPITQPQQNVTLPSPNSAPSGPQSDSENLEPIAFVQPAAAPVNPKIFTVRMGESLVKHAGRVHISQDEYGVLHLADGEALVTASGTSEVRSGRYAVVLKPGSAALVRRTAGALSVRVLYESSDSSVSLICGKDSIKISEAHEAVISANRKDLLEAVTEDGIARRHSRNLQFSDGCYAEVGEVSLVSLAHNSSALSQLMHSNNKDDKLIAQRVMKLAASLQLVTADRGAYSPAVAASPAHSANH